MPSSLYAPDFQAVLDAARTTAGRPGGPFPSPADWRDPWIYFLMVDRFNNVSAPPRHQPYDDPNYYDFQGGKFSGVRAQLPYLKRLGAGALWLSPVLKNVGWEGGTYHGYGIHDFLRADPRFADDPNNADNELRALVDAAHNQGLYVIFDIVLNHTGNVFAYQCRDGDRQCHDSGGSEAGYSDLPQPISWRDVAGTAHPEWNVIEQVADPPRDAFVWPRELQQNRFFRRQGLPQTNGDDTVGDFSSLKQIRTDDTDAQEFLIRAYQYVIARYDIDGFRIDTLRYLKGGLPRLFGNSMREFALVIGKKNFFTFGEVWSTEDQIAQFIGRHTSDGDDMVGVDAALDYPLYDALKGVVKGLAPPSNIVAMYHHRKQVEADILSSHGDATRYFVTFLDNHDVKERLRYVDPADEHRYDDQATLGLGCLFALPGIPCVYYGTEQGLHGRGSDPAVREAIWGAPGFDERSPFYVALQCLAEARAAAPALRYGRFFFRPISGDGQTFGVSPYPGGTLAFSRILSDEEVVVIANTNTAQKLTLDVIVDSSINQVGNVFKIAYSNKAQPVVPIPVRQTGAVTIYEVDGSVGHGPAHVVRVTLQPLEVQILGR